MRFPWEGLSEVGPAAALGAAALSRNADAGLVGSRELRYEERPQVRARGQRSGGGSKSRARRSAPVKPWG